METMNIVLFLTLVVSLTVSAPSGNPECFMENRLISSTQSGRVHLDSSSDFAMELFKNIINTSQSSHNVIFSPISVWAALLTTYLGANGQTKSQLSNVLGIGDVAKEIAATAYFELKDNLQSQNNANSTLRLANKIYLEARATAGFCTELLKSDVERVNFKGNPGSVREAINKWVQSQTNGKITNLLSPETISSATKMIIINAAYFKGLWEMPFHARLTQKADFFIQPNLPLQVDMMFLEETIPFVDASSSLNCTAVALPYVGRNYDMIILLPQYTTVDDLASRLTTQSLDKVINEMTLSLVRVSLPRFKSEESIELKDSLMNLGVQDLFDLVAVDLTGFTSEKQPVQSVLHKAFIEVNEEGTEAAAATSVITAFSFRHYDIFRADRPFIYIIRNIVNKTILFMGIFRKP